MKVLLDECVDWRLSRDIVGHEVKTAHQMRWATIKNGELLALAVACSPDERSEVRDRGDDYPGCRFAHPGYALLARKREASKCIEAAHNHIGWSNGIRTTRVRFID